MIRDFVIADEKPPYAEWFATIDLTDWLGTETISNVTFAASASNGTDVTSVVTDPGKNTYTSKVIKPFIRAGTSGKRYTVYMRVDTVEGSKDEFTLSFKVK